MNVGYRHTLEFEWAEVSERVVLQIENQVTRGVSRLLDVEDEFLRVRVDVRI
jgi:hypothetical protein